MCKSTRGCSCCCGYFTVVLTAIALGFPWFFVHQSASGCDLTLLYGWQSLDCIDTDCNFNVCAFYPDNWRDYETPTNDLSELKEAADLTGSFFGLGFAMLFFSVVAITPMACCYNKQSWTGEVARKRSVSGWALVLLAVSGVFQLFALVYFAFVFPDKYWEKNKSICNSCSNLYGGKDVGSKTVVWGGAGWVFGLFSFISTLIIMCCLSCARSNNELEDHGGNNVAMRTLPTQESYPGVP